jgi:hypothetical protein
MADPSARNATEPDGMIEVLHIPSRMHYMEQQATGRVIGVNLPI